MQQYKKLNRKRLINGIKIMQILFVFGTVVCNAQPIVKYDSIAPYSEGLAAVKRNNLWGFIDKTGREVISLQYDRANEFREGLAYVKLNNKYGIIDNIGKEIVPCIYNEILPFSEGLALVKLYREDQSGKNQRRPIWGFINKIGKVVIPIKYDNACAYKEGLVAVKLNNMWGFIDRTDKVVIPFKYDYASQFDKNYAYVRKSNAMKDSYWIDKKGNEYTFGIDRTTVNVQMTLSELVANMKLYRIDNNIKIIKNFEYIIDEITGKNIMLWKRRIS